MATATTVESSAAVERSAAAGAAESATSTEIAGRGTEALGASITAEAPYCGAACKTAGRCE